MELAHSSRHTGSQPFHNVTRCTFTLTNQASRNNHVRQNSKKEVQKFADNPELIRKRIETVEQALGQVATGELHLPVTKTLMESALKHNKEIAKDEDFLHLMVRCNFDKTDPEFMKKFAAMGGDTKQLAAVKTQRENDENEWKNLKDTIDQNKIPLPQGLPNLMPKLKPN